MYVDMSNKYTNYLKYYIEVCMKTDLLTDPTKTFSDEIRKLPTAELLGNYDYFRKFTTMIFQMFQNANFCKQTRLMSNVIFMLLKDLMEIYRFYHNHVTEIFERFPMFNAMEAQRAYVMYENFVKLTDHFKVKGGKLIYMFNFPITLPEFYKVDQEQMDTLKAIVNSLQDEMPVAEVPDKK